MDEQVFWTSRKKLFFIASAILFMAALVIIVAVESAGAEPAVTATYTHNALHLTIPFLDAAAGSGNLSIEILDPDGHILGRTEKHLELAAGSGQWTGQVKLDKPIALEDLVWERLHYRFDYDNGKKSAFEGTKSISTILRTPVVHILGQQS